MIFHGGLIATLQSGKWCGVLVRGPSGVGKSDLALRALGVGFRLVADDRVVLFTSKGRLFGRAPKPLDGLIEVRGLGVIAVDSLRVCEILLAVDCVESAAVTRMPDMTAGRILDVPIPTLALCPIESSAPAKLCRAIEVLGRAKQQDYDAAFPQTVPRGSA